jgi:hypothetical protein
MMLMLDRNHSFKIIPIFDEFSKTLVLSRSRADKATGCKEPVPTLTQQNIDAKLRTVAQMGLEPVLDAMLTNPNFHILIAGRAYDPAPYNAYAAFASRTSLKDTSEQATNHFWGGSLHTGKILERGGLCGEPKSHGVMATLCHYGSFDAVPLDSNDKYTPIFVAAHTLVDTKYKLVKFSDLLSTSSIAEIFKTFTHDIVWNGFYDQALTHQVTIARSWNGKPIASGGNMENNVHASQQYIGFMNLELPQDLVKDFSTL